MLGAIIGDIVGSRFEFNNLKSKEFELFDVDSRFTDDTVLTIAVMDWAVHHRTYLLEEANSYLLKWARRYPLAGYGGMFSRWMNSINPKPYNSYGNGSAMRISACGWLFDNEEKIKRTVYAITSPTHNHPEGIKGAEVTAMCIYMARTGQTKEQIKDYASKYYQLDFDYEDLKKTNYHGEEICQITVPQAIYCFLISDSFEDCLRTTVSIGGDTDTLCAISCAIAEAYYGEIPEEIIREAMNRLPDDMKQVIKDFDQKCGEGE